MNAITVKKSDVAFLVARTFPDYAGRKFRVNIAASVILYDLNWSGGTRNAYRVTSLNRDNDKARAVPAPAPWANPYEGATMPVPPGIAVIEHSMFCGKDCGIRIYVNPADIAAGFLPVSN